MSKFLQIADGDAGCSIGGQNYNFSDVDSLAFTYSKTNNLTRGSNGQNKVGITFQENLKEADSLTMMIKDCSTALYKLLLAKFDDQSRLDVWFINRQTGEGYTYTNALITNKPRQESIGEGEDSIGFSLVVKSYDITEKFNDDV
tara:strand:- start:5030 stop:5461 length:432 start_codon:yes stop_codon:yes gene_type:complete